MREPANALDIGSADRALEFMRIAQDHYFRAPRWLRRSLHFSTGPVCPVAAPDFRRWLASKNELV